MSDDDNVLPFPSRPSSDEVLLQVGGPIDECGMTLAIYGVDLEPDDVTAKLGVEPTSAHRRGERRGPRSPPYRMGAWFLEHRVMAPEPPQDALERLLEALPGAEAPVWAELRACYDVQLRVALFFEGWNRGFGLDAGVVQRVCGMVTSVEFDIYAEGDGDE